MPQLQRLWYRIMSSKVIHEFLKQKEVAGTKGNLSYCSCLNPEYSLSQPVSNTILHVGLNGRPGRGTGCFFFLQLKADWLMFVNSLQAAGVIATYQQFKYSIF